MAIFNEQQEFCALSLVISLLFNRRIGEVRVKKGIDYFEFRDGYAVTTEAEVMGVILGYREGRLKRGELRVFAARLEQAALHKKSKVDLTRVLNCRSGVKGIRRLRTSEIERAREALDGWFSGRDGEISRAVVVSRRVLRHIAQGRCTSNEAIVLLYYMLRRIRQAKRVESLNASERYARFTYGELQELSGIPRGNVSRAVARLKARGWLNTVEVAKRNENAYGQLFVDGALISLAGARRRVNKRGRTKGRSEQNDNTPVNETTTLIKKYYPKTKIRPLCGNVGEKKGGSRRLSEEFERIKRRAEQMKAELSAEAA